MVVANGTSFLLKDVTIPTGSTLELLTGGKVVKTLCSKNRLFSADKL